MSFVEFLYLGMCVRERERESQYLASVLNKERERVRESGWIHERFVRVREEWVHMRREVSYIPT